MPRGMRLAPAAAMALALLAATCAQAQIVQPLPVSGDAIPTPLTDMPGDAAKGRAIVANRQVGLCLLCHSGPFPEERFQGTLAPSLEGAGARWSAGQLRLRIADTQRLNPSSIMPSYHRADGLTRVAAAWKDKPLFSAQQVEDVVAYLQTLKN